MRRSFSSRGGAGLHQAWPAGEAPARLGTRKEPAAGSPAAWGIKKRGKMRFVKPVSYEHPALKGHSQTYERSDESQSACGRPAAVSAAGTEAWGRQTLTCFSSELRFARTVQLHMANPTAFPTPCIAGLRGGAQGCGAEAALPSLEQSRSLSCITGSARRAF